MQHTVHVVHMNNVGHCTYVERHIHMKVMLYYSLAQDAHTTGENRWDMCACFPSASHNYNEELAIT